MTNVKKRSVLAGPKKVSTVGKRIIEGPEEAIAWSKGDDVPVRVTYVQVPDVDISKVRRQMRLSQTQFALKFGFPPATLTQLGAGTSRPSRYAHSCIAGRNREASLRA